MSLASLCAVALAAAAARALRRELRGFVALGLLAVAFGLASAAVAGAVDPTLGGARSISRSIDAGFVIAGALLVTWAAVRALFTPRTAPGRSVHPRLAAAVLAATAMLLGWLARELIVPAGISADVAAAAVLLTGAALTSVIGIVSRRRPSGIPPTPCEGGAPTPWSRGRRATAAAGALLAIAAPKAWLVIGGALLAAGAASLVLLVVTAVGLLPSLWFLRTVAGPVGLGLATLDAVPLSAAAEAMLAPALALGTVGLFGLWPLRRWGTPLVLPVGVAVMLRLGVAIPAGLASWETVLVPLGVIALVHALVVAEAAEALAAGAWLAAVTGGRAAAILLAAAVVLGVVAARFRPSRPVAASWAGAAASGAAAAGGALALQALLGTEVVYAVVSMLIVGALIARTERSAA